MMVWKSLLEYSIIIYALGGLAGAVFHKNYRRSLEVSCILSFIASLLLLYTSTRIMLNGVVLTGEILYTPVYIDGASALMMMVLGLIGVATSIYSPPYMLRYIRLGHGWLYGLLYNIYMASMVMVLISRNLIIFLLFWEVMTSVSYMLIIWEHDIERVRVAAFRYFIIMHVFSTLPLTLAVLRIHHEYGVFDLNKIPHMKDPILFSLLLVGCGSKTAVFPFYFWMPEAQMTAPSPISALITAMSSVAFVSLFKFMYMYMIELTIAGYIVMLMGLVTIILCTLFMIGQHEYKRVLSYHGIGLSGYTWFIIGAGMVLYSIGGEHRVLGVIAFATGLLQVLNNTLFKASLFLSAGSILFRTRAYDILSMEGISLIMPITVISISLSTLSLIGVPPLIGFFSKWMIYLTTILSGKFLIAFGGLVAYIMTLVTLIMFMEIYMRTLWRWFNIKAFIAGRHYRYIDEIPSPMILGQLILTIPCIILGLLAPSLIEAIVRTSAYMIEYDPDKVAETLTLTYYIPLITPKTVNPVVSILVSKILFIIIVGSIVSIIIGYSKLGVMIEHGILEEYKILRKKLLEAYRVERKIVYYATIMLSDIAHGIGRISQTVHRIYSLLEHSFQKIILALINTYRRTSTAFSTASSKVGDAMYGVIERASNIVLVASMVKEQTLKTPPHRVKEIYIDEIIWAPFMELVKRVLFRRWSMGLQAYLALSIAFLTILLLIMVIAPILNSVIWGPM